MRLGKSALKAMRIVLTTIAIYLAALGTLDAAINNGRLRKAVWQEANHQVYRVTAEVRHLLVRIGI